MLNEDVTGIRDLIKNEERYYAVIAVGNKGTYHFNDNTIAVFRRVLRIFSAILHQEIRPRG